MFVEFYIFAIKVNLVKIAICDFDLLFEGDRFSTLISLKWLEQSQKFKERLL